MTKQDALAKIKELEDYINSLDECGFKDDILFLLSIEEYEKYKDNIPHINTWWWLRSPGLINRNVADVTRNYSVDDFGNHVNFGNGAVRPALKYKNLKSAILESKEVDCFIWNETKWKIIDFEKEIAIAYMPINFDIFDSKDNNYEKSHIRKWILKLAYK